jgi:hypothetical protein
MADTQTKGTFPGLHGGTYTKRGRLLDVHGGGHGHASTDLWLPLDPGYHAQHADDYEGGDSGEEARALTFHVWVSWYPHLP